MGISFLKLESKLEIIKKNLERLGFSYSNPKFWIKYNDGEGWGFSKHPHARSYRAIRDAIEIVESLKSRNKK